MTQYSSMHAHRRGFSLIELMVAMTLSLVLLGGVVTLFASSRKSYESNDHLARIQENGRFALDQIQREVRSAGYAGCAKSAPVNTLNSGTSLAWNLGVQVAGFQWTGTSTWSPTVDPLVQSPAATNSDILVVRAPDPDARVVFTTGDMGNGTATIQVPAGTSYAVGDVLMISDCQATAIFEVSGYTSSTGVIQHQVSGGVANKSPGNASGDVGYAFQAGATLVPVRTTIFYVRAASAGNGNSLWRRVGIGTAEELVEGVDSLQTLYGVDADGNRIVDGPFVRANAVVDWSTVMAVQIGLLVRSVDQYGQDADTSHPVLDATIAAAGDNRERLVFTATATMRNRAL